MASEESFVVLVHHRGSVNRKTRSGVKFTDKNPLCIVITSTTSYDDLVSAVLMKLGLEGAKRVNKFFYRIPVTVLQNTVKYDCFTINNDVDLQVMFLCRRQFPKSGGLNRNTNTIANPAGSSSRLAVASSSVPVYEPVVQHVASPSFAVDLNGTEGDEVVERENLPNALVGVAPVGVGDGFLDDEEEDDVEPDMIDDDSADDIGATGPALEVGGSSSGTQQYPPHFSSLDLDAMRHEVVLGHAVGFGARDAEGSTGLTEFQVGQQFQDKDEALLSVKTYSIRRGRKGIWEVKRYNGPHTCLVVDEIVITILCLLVSL
ncbi:hypothetical protein Ahy_A02g007477 isoform C [Arachis hypogaea]|uniref:Transposase MuDR plant domain-containing protein n=1 Tax=Arachis hypogaea TaxID=3818 RepID=A0A445ECV5_ARAHY|nr:hypothetical protein Ahy_A02g007477 isoform C [Arachis hypogaea]